MAARIPFGPPKSEGCSLARMACGALFSVADKIGSESQWAGRNNHTYSPMTTLDLNLDKDL